MYNLSDVSKSDFNLTRKEIDLEKYIAFIISLFGYGYLGALSDATHDIKIVSSGQLQRAAICRALINQPAILFADEPTGSLNLSASKEIMNIMNEINRTGTTIILVTHDPKVSARSNRVIFLADGTITDEIELGKYEEKKFVKLENQMIQWLGEQIF